MLVRDHRHDTPVAAAAVHDLLREHLDLEVAVAGVARRFCSSGSRKAASTARAAAASTSSRGVKLSPAAVPGITARFLAAGSGAVARASAPVGRRENWRAFIEQAGKARHRDGPNRMNSSARFYVFAQ